MTTNKPEIVAWFKPASDATLNSVDVVITDRSMKDRPEISTVGFTEPLVRLSDYETLKAERDALVEALEIARDRLESERRSGEFDSLIRDIDDAVNKGAV